MVNGLYTASRAMTHILSKQDVHAQNLANTSTNGFKMARLVSKSEVSIGRNEDGELKQKENQELSEVFTSFQQGPMVLTGNKFDLALSGPGFLTVEAEDGTRYTRNGGLSLNSFGELVTLSGKRLLDDGGAPIILKGDDVQFGADGSIFMDGKKTATLGVADFADTRKLQYGADGLFSNSDPENNPAHAPEGVEIKAGYLEGSNADPISTMVSMIVDYRSYEADQKALKAVDDTLRQAVTEVGKV
ncbi:MAG: flagellar basal-body rod protein FlgF [Fibrobacteres bacterium]|nr:flagellar basal-body rod protein FlgF [Fibrobacterota bacterium]